MPEEIPEAFLKTPDLIIMILYLTGLLGMGLYYRKFAQQSLEHYFLAGRKLPGWLAGVSMATTCMNADVAPAYCGMTVITGVFVCWWYIGRFGLALMIASILCQVCSSNHSASSRGEVHRGEPSTCVYLSLPLQP